MVVDCRLVNRILMADGWHGVDERSLSCSQDQAMLKLDAPQGVERPSIALGHPYLQWKEGGRVTFAPLTAVLAFGYDG